MRETTLEIANSVAELEWQPLPLHLFLLACLENLPSSSSSDFSSLIGQNCNHTSFLNLSLTRRVTGLDQSGFTSLVHGLRTVFTEEHSDREKGGHQSKTAFYQEGGRSKWPWGKQPTGVLWSHGWRLTGLVKEEDGRGILGEDNKDFPGGSEGKASACKAGDLSSIPGSGRSPGEGNGNPLQYSCQSGGLQPTGSQRVGHDWSNFTSLTRT